eukprot:2072291-Rhodomonas_salina.1
MRADAYGDALADSPITDILNMPLPGDDEDEPTTTDINDSFDAFNDVEITDKAISTGLLDNDIHPAVTRARAQQASNTDTPVRGGESVIDDDVADAQCDVPSDSASAIAARRGSRLNGETGNRGGMQAPVSGLKRARPLSCDVNLPGPSRGALKPGDRRERFPVAPPPLGTPVNNTQCSRRSIGQRTLESPSKVRGCKCARTILFQDSSVFKSSSRCTKDDLLAVCPNFNLPSFPSANRPVVLTFRFETLFV